MVAEEAWGEGRACLFPFWSVTALVILEWACQDLWGSFLALPPRMV